MTRTSASLPKRERYFPFARSLFQIGIRPTQRSVTERIELRFNKSQHPRIEQYATINLSTQDKLELLRRLDSFRQWSSLDDRRSCLACGKIITGWQISVSGGTRGHGPLRLHCPTNGCSSIPIDWVLPTDGMHHIAVGGSRQESRQPNAVGSPQAKQAVRERVRAGRLRSIVRGFRFPKLPRAGV